VSGRALTLVGIVYVALLLLLPGPASTHELGVSAIAAQEINEPCPGGDPINPNEAEGRGKVITGRFDDDLEGGYALLPFDVPAGQTAVRVKYCFDQPDLLAPRSPDRHTLDLGLYEPRADDSVPWGLPEFRGWGGSSHPDVTLSEQGYSSEAMYMAKKREPGRTTRAFEPGPIPEGEWAVELGLASITETGDLDGGVEYRVEIEWSKDPTFDDDPYVPAPYDESPAASGAGWYAGDFHVHAEHSALGDATMTETFDYAFRERDAQPEGGAGLDFITLSDYVSGSSWDEIGRYQAQHPGKLVVRSAEVITYEGHANSHANTSVVDYRLGPLYERQDDESLTTVRSARPASEIFDRVRGAGGFTQISHPTIFPSEVPVFASLCRGCPWDYDAASTDYSKVDAIEIATGPPGLREAPTQPGPNPFTVTALRFWEEALDDGHKIAAVASSDSHNAGRAAPVTQAPIGTATTVVRADELSEDGIQKGVEAGHTYVKVYGGDGPDLRFEAVPDAEGARAAQAADPAIMGDTVAADGARFTARVLGGAPGSIAARPDPLTLLVLRDGVPVRPPAPVTSDDFELAFEATDPGRYRLQVMRGTAIEAVSSPIYLEATGADAPGGGAGDGTGGTGGRDGERRAQDGPAEPIARAPRSDAGDDPVQSLSDGGGGELPFTGLALTTLALLGAGLVCAGARLRRRA
jgi:hypothetical protein